MKKPEECRDIKEIRNAIDKIDKKIIDLLSDRFTYVKEVVKYKDNTIEGIIAEDRRKEVIKTRKEWAEKKGLDPYVIEKVYTILTEYFINEEIKLLNK